jgi:hypothetical protein
MLAAAADVLDRVDQFPDFDPRRDSKEILGASLLGTGCDEAVHAILDLMYAKAPYTVMQRAMHIHPTVSELLPTILGKADFTSGGPGA